MKRTKRTICKHSSRVKALSQESRPRRPCSSADALCLHRLSSRVNIPPGGEDTSAHPPQSAGESVLTFRFKPVYQFHYAKPEHWLGNDERLCETHNLPAAPSLQYDSQISFILSNFFLI